MADHRRRANRPARCGSAESQILVPRKTDYRSVARCETEEGFDQNDNGGMRDESDTHPSFCESGSTPYRRVFVLQPFLSLQLFLPSSI